MATRSTIAVKHGDRIKAIYCHWDGYLEHLGIALNIYYQDSIKVNKLISMGDISNIGAEIGEKHEFGTRAEYLETGVATQCTFYGRDREETDIEFQSFADEAEWMDRYDGCGAEFYYLFDHGVWYVSAYRGEFKPLHEELAKLAKEEA
jgi:hypothetical protein